MESTRPSTSGKVLTRAALLWGTLLLGPAACTHGGAWIPPAGAGIGVSNVRIGPGKKVVVEKRPPSLLLARDGTGCDVSPDRYRDTAVGDVFDCPDWREGPAP